MSAENYWIESEKLLGRIRETQSAAVQKAAAMMAESIRRRRWVYLFGSGHSVIPVLDVFPRYGSFVGFRPLMDPRLMWFNVIGPGGAPELLWLERREGYVANFLNSFEFTAADTLLVFSHGGLNAAPIEAGLYAREREAKVVAVTSLENSRQAEAKHSSGLKLADVADVAIDNCVPPEDALVDVGRPERVGAGSTLAVIVIGMALVSETARTLSEQGIELHTFVSPNVEGVSPDHNERVFAEYRRRVSAQRP
jgi:uncharacterized phosphosugar-binding protein